MPTSRSSKAKRRQAAAELEEIKSLLGEGEKLEEQGALQQELRTGLDDGNLKVVELEKELDAHREYLKIAEHELAAARKTAEKSGKTHSHFSTLLDEIIEFVTESNCPDRLKIDELEESRVGLEGATQKAREDLG